MTTIRIDREVTFQQPELSGEEVRINRSTQADHFTVIPNALIRDEALSRHELPLHGHRRGNSAIA